MNQARDARSRRAEEVEAEKHATAPQVFKTERDGEEEYQVTEQVKCARMQECRSYELMWFPFAVWREPVLVPQTARRRVLVGSELLIKLVAQRLCLGATEPCLIFGLDVRRLLELLGQGL